MSAAALVQVTTTRPEIPAAVIERGVIVLRAWLRCMRAEAASGEVVFNGPEFVEALRRIAGEGAVEVALFEPAGVLGRVLERAVYDWHISQVYRYWSPRHGDQWLYAMRNP